MMKKKNFVEAIKEIQNNNDIIVTVIGEFGVGKSSLINLLTFSTDLKVSDGVVGCTTFDSRLDSKIKYKEKFLLFQDSPGFARSNNAYINYQLIKIAITLCLKSKLFLFVIKKGRFSEINQKLFQKIDKIFGDIFWYNAILVFTYFDVEYINIFDNSERYKKFQEWLNEQCKEELFKQYFSLFKNKFFLFAVKMNIKLI